MTTNPENITIYAPNGNKLFSVDFGDNAESVEDLMHSDYVQLHWESTDGAEIPAGAYISYGGRKYTLLDPYTPEQADELQHTYTPQFQSRIMGWGKIPYFHYNQGSTTPGKEPDWSLTANASTHLASIVAALKTEGEGTWTVEMDDAMRSMGAITISFQTVDILSGLNAIASAFDGEWMARENTTGANGGTIYFAKRIAQGTAVALTVGDNVGVPSITESKEGYYNRFYVFGSTRNVTQDYAGANVNTLINKRLTLNPTEYPGGYIDTRKDSKEPIYSKTLTFDDIYPRAHLEIGSSALGLRARLMYRLDEATSLPRVIGSTSDGKPIYDQYVVWYFRPVVSDTGKEFAIANPTTYDPETNPTGELLKGKTLSVHFSSGLLNGREFELRYVDANEKIKGQSFPSLGLSTPDFEVYKGDFEIKYVEDGSMIVPTDVSGGVHPQVGDNLTLYNLRMPDTYTSSAQTDLKNAALETIAERYDADLNNYTLPSNQVAFAKNDPGLTIGRAVKYTNGSYSYTTRVIRVVKKLGSPNLCEQEITIGSEKIKGDRQTLKEDVVVANQNIEQLAALNNLTETLAQSYARAQQIMLDGFAQMSRLWYLDEDGNVCTDRNVCSAKDIVALGSKSWGGGSFGGSLADLSDVKLTGLAKDDLIQWNGTEWVNVKASELGVGSGNVDLTAYLKVDGSNGTASGVSALIRTLGAAAAEVKDDTLIVTSDNEGQTDAKPNYYRRSATAFWQYILNKDGSGSGLDSDLLDGLHASSFLTGIPTAACTADYPTYMTGLRGVTVRSGETTASFGAIRAMDTVLDVGYSWARFFRLMHNRVDGNLRFQGSKDVENGAWGTERTLLDTVNYAGVIDGRYVKKSGDTMSGVLGITRAASDDSAGYTKGFIYRNTGGAKPYIHIGHGTGGKNNGTNIGFCYKGENSTSNYLFFGFSANNELMNLTAAGNLGIGTTTPADKLHVHDGAIRVSFVQDDRYTYINPGALRFRVRSESADNTNGVFVDGNAGGVLGIIGGSVIKNKALSYLCYGGTAHSDPAMVILPNKYVGIGTTAPTYKLHVMGGSYFEGSCVVSGSGSFFGRSGAAYGGTSWHNGVGALSVGLQNNTAQTTLLLAQRTGVAWGATGANRLYAMEMLNDGTVLRFNFGGNHRFAFYSNGNFEAMADVVALNSSDRRLKQRFAIEDYADKLLRLGRVMSYEWRDMAREMDPGKYDALRHSSVVWQRARKVGIPGFCGVDERGYGYVNWLNKDYQATLLGAVQDHERRLRAVEKALTDKCA